MAVADPYNLVSINQKFLERAPTDVELGEQNAWVQSLINQGKSLQDARNALKMRHVNSQEFHDLLKTKKAPALAKDIFGRDLNENEKQENADYLVNLMKGGKSYEDSIASLQDRYRSSPEYNSMGGRAGEFVRQVVDNVNKGVTELPPFQWTAENEANAKAYAEEVYGPYFADLVKEAVDLSNVGLERNDQDTQLRIRNINQSLNDYLNGSQTQQQRIEQDYTKARENTARQLGISLDAFDTAKQRSGEDTDRTLAELQVDYERSGGRINQDKAQGLQRLLQDEQTRTGRLTQDQEVALKNVNQQMERRQYAEEESLANRGQVYGGERVRTERIRAEDRANIEGDINRQTERGLADTQLASQRNQFDLAQTAQRQLENIQTSYDRSSGDVSRSYQRNLADISRQEQIARENAALQNQTLDMNQQRATQDIATETGIQQRNAAQATQAAQLQQSRSAEDIARQLEQQQKTIEQQKQAEIETGYFGINAQQDQASEEYSRQLADQERRRLEVGV